MESATRGEANIQVAVTAELNEFISKWEAGYSSKVSAIPLFINDQVAAWTVKQKQHFAKVFYHARGRFHDFLWYMGNFSPNREAKKMVLENIHEEFGKNGLSHEQLYFRFAQSLGVDISEELVSEACYLPFVRNFNKRHIEWLVRNDWPSQIAAFSAYEKLDNIDYKNLVKFAEAIGVPKYAMTFFTVHVYVEHFESAYYELANIWQKNKSAVKSAFEFIGEYQIKIWQNLVDTIFSKNT